jgi:hypothetical protein
VAGSVFALAYPSLLFPFSKRTNFQLTDLTQLTKASTAPQIRASDRKSAFEAI